MAGVKGKSGNWSKLDKDIMNVNLGLCDVLLHQYLLDENIDKETKIAKIIPLLAKRVPQTVKTEVDTTLTVKEPIKFTWTT